LAAGREVILGIDPGTIVLGFGLIGIENMQPGLIEMGVLQLSHKDDHAERLHLIFNKISALIKAYQPSSVAIEAPFFGKNVQSMLKLGRAQGVAMAAAMAQGIPTTEYAPRKIKQSITGRGNATKEQVWLMLQHTMKITDDPAFFDATDAVAAALCHHYQSGPTMLVSKPKKAGKAPKSSWEQFVATNPDRIKQP
jgi:crossover junction endodeoxyribonuclease RuvC